MKALRKFSGVLISTVLLAATGVMAAPTVSANFNEQGCAYGDAKPCPANSRHHIFYYGDSMSSSATYWTNATRSDSYNNVPGWTTARTEYHGSSDVHMMLSGNGDGIPGNLSGHYSCSEIGSGRVCDHGHVRIRSSAFDALDGSERQSLLCHEIGHSVGLTHPADDGQVDNPSEFHCMTNSSAVYPPFLGTHNTGHMQDESYYN
ncbi:hypothetical protein [Janibacter sp. UYMM211]|uniref:hypothetical protein n=1 Tax=Janibacter sp. UYMM211 TaxID=3156342 RepID=UPI0033926718